ncbi:hypothetical protein CB1_001907069 [Camelus ferus]|nr:hypothetical protein CB1_001907069 [Camelus ferus]
MGPKFPKNMRFAKKHKKMGPRRMQAVMPVPRVRVPRLSGPYKGKKAKPKIAKGSASAVDLPTLQTPDSGSLLVLHHPRNQALPAESKTEVQTKAQLNLLLQLQLSSSSCSAQLLLQLLLLLDFHLPKISLEKKQVKSWALGYGSLERHTTLGEGELEEKMKQKEVKRHRWGQMGYFPSGGSGGETQHGDSRITARGKAQRIAGGWSTSARYESAKRTEDKAPQNISCFEYSEERLRVRMDCGERWQKAQ